MSLARPFYRSRQVLLALRPRLEDSTLSLARQYLSEPELRLFLSMEKRDQRHALEVAGRLRDKGFEVNDLLAAALLHDCGKGAVPVWLRIANVLSPALVHSIAKKDSDSWQAAAYRLAHHVELSAVAASVAGAAPAVVRLIQGKPAPDEAWMLPLLIAADDAS
jgi:hypothetical protein